MGKSQLVEKKIEVKINTRSVSTVRTQSFDAPS